MKVKTIGTLVTEAGERVVVERDSYRTISMRCSHDVVNLTSDEVEKLRNLLEQADSSR